MDCKEAKILLSRQLTGNGIPGDGGALRSHVMACPACQQKEKRLRKIWDAAGSIDSVQVSKDQEEKTLSCLQQKLHWRRSPIWLAIPIAACLFIAIITFILTRPNQLQEAPLVSIVDGNPKLLGDRVLTADRSSIIKLYDNTVITLDTKTEVKVEKPGEKRVVYMEEGSATFEVTRDEKEFEVKTVVAKIRVVGTKFQVFLKEENMKKVMVVLVFAGTIQVGNKVETITANQGDRVVVSQDERPLRRVEEPVSQDKWTKDKIVALLCAKHSENHYYQCERARFTGRCQENEKHVIKNPLEGPCPSKHPDLRDGHEVSHCLDCAKKKSVCFVCGGKLGETKSDYKQLLEAHQKNDCSRIKAGAHAARILHGKYICKLCQEQKDEAGCPSLCGRYACEPCAQREGLCNLCGVKLQGKEVPTPDNKQLLELHKKTCTYKCCKPGEHAHKAWAAILECRKCKTKSEYGEVCFQPYTVKEKLCHECVLTEGKCPCCGSQLLKDLERHIRELIKQLDSDDPNERDATTEKLIGLGKHSKGFVTKALEETKDPEVKSRLEKILREISRQEEKESAKEIEEAKTSLVKVKLTQAQSPTGGSSGGEGLICILEITNLTDKEISIKPHSAKLVITTPSKMELKYNGAYWHDWNGKLAANETKKGVWFCGPGIDLSNILQGKSYLEVVCQDNKGELLKLRSKELSIEQIRVR